MRFALILFACQSTLAFPHLAAAAETWRAGVAQTVITPDGPYWMGGYASRKRPSEGTLQDLHAKVLVLEDSHESRLVVVTLDLLVITPRIADGIAAKCKTRFGLSRQQLLLNCSHTHCGPELRLYREEVHEIPGVFADKMRKYVASLQEKVVNTIGRAIENRRAVRLQVSQSEATFAINRRNNRGADIAKRTSEGTLQGPVDHDVPVLQVISDDDRRLALLFGYACHNTTLSIFQTCGDYAGYAQQYLEADFPRTQAMFIMGAGGDQNPSPRRTVALAQQHGRALATAVKRALDGPQRALSGRLRVGLAQAELEFQPHADRAALQQQLKSKNQYQRWKAGFVLRELDAGRELSRRYELPVQAIAFGDQLLMITVGGETVVDYAVRLKREHQRDGGPLIWVAGYSNDVFGYLPSQRVLKEGGYEGGDHMVYTKFPGPFTESVEERIFAAVGEALRQHQTSR